MNKKITLICGNGIFKYVKDYINSFNKYVNFDLYIISLVTPNEEICNMININELLIFIQGIPYDLHHLVQNKKYFILNIEQLCNHKKIKYIINEQNIIDYSTENLILAKSKLNKQNLFYFPYGYNPNEIRNFEKTKNIAIIANYKNARRCKIMNELSNSNCEFTNIDGLFSERRDEILFRHKILVNIHFDQNYMIHENMRCDRCIFNKMIVISEKSLFDEKLPLNKFMILVDYDEIVETSINVSNNYEFYYNKIFVEQNFDSFMETYKIELQNIYDVEINKMINC
jgi:hypothetical protein